MSQYHITQKIMHWFMALIIISLLIMGYIMQDLPREIKYSIYGIHKSFGVLILGLIIFRIYLRLKYQAPPLSKKISKYTHIISNISHKSLYILMIIMPISGYIMSNAKGHVVKFFNIQLPFITKKNQLIGDIAHDAHSVIAIILITIIILHILGTIKHQLSDKNFIKRMF